MRPGEMKGKWQLAYGTISQEPAKLKSGELLRVLPAVYESSAG
jgi:hypothetical protein